MTALLASWPLAPGIGLDIGAAAAFNGGFSRGGVGGWSQTALWPVKQVDDFCRDGRDLKRRTPRTPKLQATREDDLLADVPTSTIRYYERRGLLKPDDCSYGNYRLYGNEAVEIGVG